MSRYDLLPPNATTLERDLSRSTSSLQRIAQKVPIIRTAKRRSIPDSVVPWLVYEYGLAEILPYVTDERTALALGLPWQRIRGTPESVRLALQWIGITGLVEESERGSVRWAEYMLGLAAPVIGEQMINRMTAVAALSTPVRSKLQRIYAVYDVRQFILDDSFLDDGMLDDHSGVRPRPDWPQISYGDYRKITATLTSNVSNTIASTVSLLLTWAGPTISSGLANVIGYSVSRFDSTTNWSNQLNWGSTSWEGTGYVVSNKITTST